MCPSSALVCFILISLTMNALAIKAHMDARQSALSEHTEKLPADRHQEGVVNVEDKRLDHLLTYTVFHIGIYISLVAAVIGADAHWQINSYLLRFSALCFVIAGACGGIVGSTIPEHRSIEDFAKAKIGPFGLPMMRYPRWVTLEHLAFWLGILPIVVSYVCCGVKVLQSAGNE